MMARKSQTDELYDVAVLLLTALKAICRNVAGLNGGPVKALIRRAEKTTKARPK